MMMGRLDRKTLETFPHNVFPSINLHKHDVLQEDSLDACIREARDFFKPFPYNVSLPVPLMQPIPATVEGKLKSKEV